MNVNELTAKIKADLLAQHSIDTVEVCVTSINVIHGTTELTIEELRNTGWVIINYQLLDTELDLYICLPQLIREIEQLTHYSVDYHLRESLLIAAIVKHRSLTPR